MDIEEDSKVETVKGAKAKEAELRAQIAPMMIQAKVSAKVRNLISRKLSSFALTKYKKTERKYQGCIGNSHEMGKEGATRDDTCGDQRCGVGNVETVSRRQGLDVVQFHVGTHLQKTTAAQFRNQSVC